MNYTKNNHQKYQPRSDTNGTTISQSTTEKMQEAVEMLKTGIPVSVICKSLKLSPKEIKNLNINY